MGGHPGGDVGQTRPPKQLGSPFVWGGQDRAVPHRALRTPASRTQAVPRSFLNHRPPWICKAFTRPLQICSVLYRQLFPQDRAKQHRSLSYLSHSVHIPSVISLIITHLASIPAGHPEASLKVFSRQKQHFFYNFAYSTLTVVEYAKLHYYSTQYRLGVPLGTVGLGHKHLTEPRYHECSLHLVFLSSENHQRYENRAALSHSCLAYLKLP